MLRTTPTADMMRRLLEGTAKDTVVAGFVLSIDRVSRDGWVTFSLHCVDKDGVTLTDIAGDEFTRREGDTVVLSELARTFDFKLEAA